MSNWETMYNKKKRSWTEEAQTKTPQTPRTYGRMKWGCSGASLREKKEETNFSKTAIDDIILKIYLINN